MVEAITATYVENEDDWSVTVSGMGEELTEHAPGIIAARDRADQLIDSLKPEDGEAAVVHLLHGSALEFTTTYMTARLSRTEDAKHEHPIPEQTTGAGAEEQHEDVATEEHADSEQASDEAIETTNATEPAEPANAG